MPIELRHLNRLQFAIQSVMAFLLLTLGFWMAWRLASQLYAMHAALLDWFVLFFPIVTLGLAGAWIIWLLRDPHIPYATGPRRGPRRLFGGVAAGTIIISEWLSGLFKQTTVAGVIALMISIVVFLAFSWIFLSDDFDARKDKADDKGQ